MRFVYSHANLAAAVLAILPGIGSTPATATSRLVIVESGQSQYAITYAAGAPVSISTAATDLQAYVRRASGVTLPVLSEGHTGSRPLLVLGDTSLGRARGIRGDEYPLDGFAIRVRGRNIFIVGNDTPSGEVSRLGGVSTGTANGIYTFLEQVVGVRWLMPGTDGDDVPETSIIAMPVKDVVEHPTFLSRRLAYLQESRPDVVEWSRRQKLGTSLRLEHAHNWSLIQPDLFSDHPEWFAEIGGKRVQPNGDYYKLETTNKELVRAFAERAIEKLQSNPRVRSFSLSPNDGEGWSQSPESSALTERDPNGNPSVTPLVMKFYNDVAAIVERPFPDRFLCGYVYADYLYPPKSGVPQMEPNVCLVFAPNIDYGYQLFRPNVRRDFQTLAALWGRAVPMTGYYDLPSRLVDDLSAPTPVASSILSLVFPTVASAGMKEVYIYGVSDWGVGAATNYVEARLTWNPHLDPKAVTSEFFLRAYGPAAGKMMYALNDRLEAAFAAFYRAHADARYTLTPPMLREIYETEYVNIERTYLKALAACDTEARRSRLESFGRALTLFRWNLARRGLVGSSDSPLARSDEEMAALLHQWSADLATSPEARSAALADLQSPVWLSWWIHRRGF